VLKEMNVPKGLIGNHQRLEDMEGQLLTGIDKQRRPPGIPVQQKKKLSSKMKGKKKPFKWIAL
jgi:hypothetical protein